MAILATGGSVAGKANVNANYEFEVHTNSNPANVGYLKLAGTDNDKLKITAMGYPAISIENLEFMDTIDGSAVNTNLWNQSVATMAATTNAGGFYNLNPTNVTTANGYSIISTIQTFYVTSCLPLHFHFSLQSSIWNLATHCVFEYGWGSVATNAAPTDGVFIRAIGGQAYLVLNNGGTETSTAFTLPTAGNTDEWVIDIYASRARLYQNGTLVADVSAPASQPAATNSNRQSFFIRVYEDATGGAASPTVKLGQISVQQRNANFNKPYADKLIGMARGSWQSPSAFTQNTNWGNSAAPTTRSLSNATPCETTLGGLLRFTPTVTADTDYALFAFTVTAGYQLYVTHVNLSGPVYFSGTAAATALVAHMGVGLNASADSLATADGSGTWAARKIPLCLLNLAASPTATTIPSAFPNEPFVFPSPLVVDGGRRFHIIMRALLARTAGASEVFHMGVGIGGYFE